MGFGQPKQELTLIKHSKAVALIRGPARQSATSIPPMWVPSDGQTGGTPARLPRPLALQPK